MWRLSGGERIAAKSLFSAVRATYLPDEDKEFCAAAMGSK
jgi:hypothetical protein